MRELWKKGPIEIPVDVKIVAKQFGVEFFLGLGNVRPPHDGLAFTEREIETVVGGLFDINL